MRSFFAAAATTTQSNYAWVRVMGKTKGAYQAEFEVGTEVQVLDLETLRQFRASWKYHHPLEEDQLQYAGGHFKVKAVAFYHGGDELYQLDRASGTWHECCLAQLV